MSKLLAFGVRENWTISVHDAQGDGVVSGSAMETSMETFKQAINLAKEKQLSKTPTAA